MDSPSAQREATSGLSSRCCVPASDSPCPLCFPLQQRGGGQRGTVTQEAMERLRFYRNCATELPLVCHAWNHAPVSLQWLTSSNGSLPGCWNCWTSVSCIEG